MIGRAQKPAIIGLLALFCGGAALAGWVVFSEPVAPPPPVVEAPAEHPPEAEHAIIDHAVETFTGDYDGMIERGFVRILTTYSVFGYFLDGAKEMGLVKEAANSFVAHINKRRPKGTHKLDVLILPVPRDELIDRLLAGEGDIIAANLTITDDREAVVDFSHPRLTGIREIVVTGPAAPDIEGFRDLAAAGGVHVRKQSSYHEHVRKLNVHLGYPLPLHEADPSMEDGDLLELVDAGVIPAIIIDDHKARFWEQFFSNIELKYDLAVNVGGEIAWAMRKDSPLLKAEVDSFIKTIREGSFLGNILMRRYFTDRKWIVKPTSTDFAIRLEEAAPVLKKYAKQYGFDWLLIAAQAFQESQLDHTARSHAGAIGLMQVLPSTAKDKRVNLPDIEDIDTNVHAGVKYLRVLRDSYFSGPEFSELDSALFSFAAYNAGPRNIARARKRAKKLGLDPNVWFGNVEIAAARAISREPVIYVRNIYKYYLAYRNARLVIAARE